MTLQEVLLSLPGNSNCGLLGCDTMYICTCLSEACSSEIMGSVYKTTVPQLRWPQCEQSLQWRSQNLYSPSKTNNEVLHTLRTVTVIWVCESTVSFWCALYLYNVLCVISTNYLKLMHKREVMYIHPYVSSQTLHNRYEWLSLWRVNTNMISQVDLILVCINPNLIWSWNHSPLIVLKIKQVKKKTATQHTNWLTPPTE